MNKNTNINYTDKMVTQLLSLYSELGNEGIPEIAVTMGKTERSIRAKLVCEKVYKAIPKGSIRQDGASKKELLREIEKYGLQVEGFEGATKIALNRLLSFVTN